MNGLRALHSHGNTCEAQVTGTMHLDHGFRKVSLMLVLPAKKSVTPGQSCDQSQLALRQPTCASLGCNERRMNLGRKSLERERSKPPRAQVPCPLPWIPYTDLLTRRNRSDCATHCFVTIGSLSPRTLSKRGARTRAS